VIAFFLDVLDAGFFFGFSSISSDSSSLSGEDCLSSGDDTGLGFRRLRGGGSGSKDNLFLEVAEVVFFGTDFGPAFTLAGGELAAALDCNA